MKTLKIGLDNRMYARLEAGLSISGQAILGLQKAGVGSGAYPALCTVDMHSHLLFPFVDRYEVLWKVVLLCRLTISFPSRTAASSQSLLLSLWSTTPNQTASVQTHPRRVLLVRMCSDLKTSERYSFPRHRDAPGNAFKRT